MWMPLRSDIIDAERPELFKLGKVSRVAEVRSARVEFHRTSIVAIRNTILIGNWTDDISQWCQFAAFDGGWKCALIHPSYYETKNVCSAWLEFSERKERDLDSAIYRWWIERWISSQAFSVDEKDEHFAAKMYWPSRHEQYFVLIAVSRLAGGVSAIVIERADQSTPPYRIVNTCGNRSMVRERCQQVQLSLYKPRNVDAAAAAVTGLTRRNILAGHIKIWVWKKFYIQHSTWI